MVSYEHKIRNIYLGDDSWSPNEDTMLYVPMKEDLLDHSLNNVSITNNGISLDNTILSNMGVGYFKGSSEDRLEFSGIEFGTNDFTISWREKTLGNSNSQGTRFSTMYNSGSNWAGLLVGYHWTSLYAGTGGGSWNIINGQQVFSSTTNTRVHRVLTKEGGNWKIYRNNVLFGSATGSGSVGYSTEVIGNYRPGDKNPFYGYMSDFIVEKKAWSQQEITKYYKKTRTDYGYSGKDYQEVEYIESSGTQYINTGYNPKTNTGFEIEYEITAYIQRYGVPMGTRYNDRNQAFYFGYENNDNSYYGFGNNKADPSTVAFHGVGTRRTITYHNNVLSNGTQTVNVTTNQQPYGNLKLFCEENNGSISEQCSMKLYSCKIREGNTLIFDFMPCYRINDGEIGLYDKVNDVFYTNSGTGTFTKGPDVGN